MADVQTGHLVRLLYCLALFILGFLIAVPLAKTAVNDFPGNCFIDSELEQVNNCDLTCIGGGLHCAGGTGNCTSTYCSVSCYVLTDGSAHICTYCILCGVATLVLAALVSVLTIILCVKRRPAITTNIVVGFVALIMVIFSAVLVGLLFKGHSSFCNSMSDTGNSCGSPIMGHVLSNPPPDDYHKNFQIAEAASIVCLSIWFSLAIHCIITWCRQRKRATQQYHRQQDETVSYALATDTPTSSVA